MKELYSNDEIGRALTERDPALGALIARTGHVRVPLREDYYAALLSAIVEQQLSGRVAEVIWNRLKALLEGDIRPEKLLAIPGDDLRAVGMSGAKARYARALSEAVAAGGLRLNELEAKSDEEIIRQLTAIKGIGAWTAEMFLIFSLGRPDVFSCGDGGLQRAVQRLCGVEPTRANLLEVSSRWKPYRTYASLYLWEALNQKIGE